MSVNELDRAINDWNEAGRRDALIADNCPSEGTAMEIYNAGRAYAGKPPVPVEGPGGWQYFLSWFYCSRGLSWYGGGLSKEDNGPINEMMENETTRRCVFLYGYRSE